jgi:hypothetical protein
MSGHRFRNTMVGAAVAALVVAAPALAGRRAPAVMRAGASGPRPPRTLTVARLSHAAPSQQTPKVRGEQYREVVAPHQVHGYYGLGFGPWDPFWYPYSGLWYWGWGAPAWGWYGSVLDDHVAALEPAVPKSQTFVALRVRPSRAEVFVDSADRGKAKSFSMVTHPLWLQPGDHVIELRRKGYQDLRLDMHLDGGHAYTLRYDLTKGEGTDPRSS